MIDKIVETFFSRVIVAAIMLIVVIINANVFGAEGTGTIALVVLGVTILQLIANFVGGGTLVYLVPRKSLSQLLFLSYTWALFSNITGVCVLYFLKAIPEGFELLLLILSLINSLYYINVTIMQAKNIRLFNKYQLFQVFVLIGSFGLLLLLRYCFDWVVKVDYYLYALTLSYLFPLLTSLRFISRHVDPFNFSGCTELLKEMFRLGFWVQLSNFAQLMNYRLNYYFISYFAGRKPLGLFELGTKLSEVIWIFPKSIALVQYAKIANCDDRTYAKQLTSSLLKVVFLFTIIAVLILICIPAKWLAAIFGPEFSEAKTVIYSLAPGIVCLSGLSILSHYFSGLGKYHVNSIASLIGFCVTLIAGILLIPKAASVGYIQAIRVAGMITSVSYFSSFLFSLICFIKQTSSKMKDFLITRSDWQRLKTEIHSLLRKSKGINENT